MSTVKVDNISTLDETSSVEVALLSEIANRVPDYEQELSDIVESVNDLSEMIGDLDEAAVRKTSDTGAVEIPSGTTAQRPTPEVDGLFRYNTEDKRFEGYQDGEWKPIAGDGIPMFDVTWCADRASIPAGYVAADGQLLSRATYPTAAAALVAGKMPQAADATWLADPLQRGKYTLGDGTTTFRLPDYNGKFAGSLGAVFLRGDGALSAGQAGLIQKDQLGPMKYANNTVNTATTVYISNGVAGIGATLTRNGPGTVQATPVDAAPDGTKWITNTGDETRPLNVTGCWVIKLFGAVTEVGSANAAQLASDYANLAGRTSTVESKVAAIEATLVAGIKQMPELLWSGLVGSNGVTLNLSRPLVAGDMIWLQHADGGKLNSHPIVLTPELLAGGRAAYFIFSGGGVTGLIISSASQLITNGFTSGYSIEKVYASRAKN